MDGEAETLDAPSVLEPIFASRRIKNFDDLSRATDIGAAPVASPMVLDSSYDRRKRGARRVTRSLPPPKAAPALREPKRAAPGAAFACLNCFAQGSLAADDDDDDDAEFEFDAGVSRSSVGSLGVLCAPGFLRPSRDGEAAAQSGEDVTLNVYRFTRLSAFEWMEKYGVGIYHSAVMVRGIEYTFEAMGGVHVSKPHSAPGCVVVDQVVVGRTACAPDEIEDIVDALLPQFTPATYNKLTRNCHHFSDELCRRLTAQSIPPWVNRAANVGNAIGLRDRRKDAPAGHDGAAPRPRPRRPPPPPPVDVELTLEQHRSASDMAQRADGILGDGDFSETNDSPRTPSRTPPRTPTGQSPRSPGGRRATISFTRRSATVNV